MQITSATVVSTMAISVAITDATLPFLMAVALRPRKNCRPPRARRDSGTVGGDQTSKTATATITVEAPDVAEAKAAAAVQFDLDEVQRNRIMVQELA